MNINIQKIDNKSTKISIITNYTFSTQHALGYYDPELNQTYSFEFRRYQTINVINPFQEVFQHELVNQLTLQRIQFLM